MTKREIERVGSKQLEERERQLDNGDAEDFEGEYTMVTREILDRLIATLRKTSR